MAIPSLSLDVVGADFPNAGDKHGKSISRRFEIALCRPGEPVFLEPEPKNKVDPNAVRVLSARGIQIGYVRAERAQLISGYLRSGMDIQAVFQAGASYGAIIRITTDGTEPTLPPAAETPFAREDVADPDWDFTPDPDYPD